MSKRDRGSAIGFDEVFNDVDELGNDDDDDDNNSVASFASSFASSDTSASSGGLPPRAPRSVADKFSRSARGKHMNFTQENVDAIPLSQILEGQEDEGDTFKRDGFETAGTYSMTADEFRAKLTAKLSGVEETGIAHADDIDVLSVEKQAVLREHNLVYSGERHTMHKDTQAMDLRPDHTDEFDPRSVGLPKAELSRAQCDVLEAMEGYVHTEEQIRRIRMRSGPGQATRTSIGAILAGAADRGILTWAENYTRITDEGLIQLIFELDVRGRFFLAVNCRVDVSTDEGGRVIERARAIPRLQQALVDLKGAEHFDSQAAAGIQLGIDEASLALRTAEVVLCAHFYFTCPCK